MVKASLVCLVVIEVFTAPIVNYILTVSIENVMNYL